MKKLTSTMLITVLLITLTCSLAHAAAGDIWLAGYLLLTLRTPNEAKAFQQRIDTVQLRANDLLQLSSELPSIKVKKSKGNVCICTGDKIFLSVTTADARTANTTVDKLACTWAQRLRTILPNATPVQH